MFTHIFQNIGRIKAIILLFILLNPNLIDAQSFTDFVQKISQATDSRKTTVMDSFFMNTLKFPLIENDSLVHFIFRGSVSRVSVAGDPNGWDSSASQMSNIPATNCWYYSNAFESEARLEYKFVLNETFWILDPLNPATALSGFGPNSELQMPGYSSPPEIEYYADIDHGTFWDTLFYSSILGDERQIGIYLPAVYDSGIGRYPSIVFHDGFDFISLASVKNVLDFLIWHQRIQAVIGIFIPPVNRSEEYAGSLKENYADFIVQELMPILSRQFRLREGPQFHGTIGISNGGNISLWLGRHYSHIFGKIAAQSSYVEEELMENFLSGPVLPLQIYLDVGEYDHPVVIPLVEDLATILKDRGYDYQYLIFSEGHSWGNWAAHIDNALEFLFPVQE
jgi:enterochelin esterase-like enzyme